MIVGHYSYGGHAHLSEVMRAELLTNGITLKTCHEHDGADVVYTPAGIFDFIDSCDVIILPSRWQLEPAKSVNRLALAWSRKKAVVASPLPAYKQYGSESKNILFAETQAEWIRQLVFLRDNPDVRRSLGDHGYNEAQGRLNPRTIVDEVFNQLLSVGAWHPWKPDTFVQVIIPHYAPRLDYLKLAVDAIWKSDGPPRDVLVVSSSALAPTSEHFDSRTRIHHQADRLSFSQANNVGLRMVDSRATHFLLLNDDTIMSSHGLAGMLEAIGNRTDIIVNPYSNCDKGWLHNDSISVENLDLVPNMTIEAVGDRTEAIRHYNAPADKTLHPTTFCAMYSTLIPKNVFERVGFLGTAFSNGGEDYDYSERARKFGFQSYWTRNAWCFHFGGKTRKVAEDENFAAHHEEDFKNNDLVQKKWRTKQKKIVGIWTGPAWETWDLRSYLTGGIGGSECVEGRMAELFAENGYTVFMYGAHERKEQNGVFLVPWNEFKPEEEFFDLFIGSRNVNCIDDRLRARRILVHVHDIFLLSGKHVSDYHRSRVDKFVCLSPWHRQFVMEYHGLPADKITIIPNGVNTHLFAECGLDQKTYAKMVFSSSPDRGLDNILACLPWIKDQVPEFSLDVYYGTYNWESSARSRNDPDELRRIDSLMSELDKYKAFVNNIGRVPEPELAKAYQKAYLWSMMSTFTETYCISAKQAQATATPVVCTNIAALDTTVGKHGIQIMHHPYSREGRQFYIDYVVKLCKDKDFWQEWSRKSLDGIAGCDWPSVWTKYWQPWC